MSNIQPCDLGKAAVVLAGAMGLAIVSGAPPVEAQTLSNPVAGCIPEATSVQEGLDIVIKPGALEYEKAERLSGKFKQLAQQSRNERGPMSSISGMSMLPSYQSIVGIGPAALQIILAELREEGDDPDQWFWALIAITKGSGPESATHYPKGSG